MPVGDNRFQQRLRTPGPAANVFPLSPLDRGCCRAAHCDLLRSFAAGAPDYRASCWNSSWGSPHGRARLPGGVRPVRAGAAAYIRDICGSSRETAVSTTERLSWPSSSNERNSFLSVSVCTTMAAEHAVSPMYYLLPDLRAKRHRRNDGEALFHAILLPATYRSCHRLHRKLFLDPNLRFIGHRFYK